ncbi:uncharacterized protein MYCFIDRAFT_209597 [Pseudocercospora fijiensis CIRAD86]|uniref:Uncharacterized protein n=1 Tax=Pseudocercospora fijiensis (strain CIRAD86) TaxID=383855 RepID=N1QA02_PSEFD|nr:uncharacterized protein MYCFIDRAFT_209597 [Pseudocercospora fijiensis CIRAD86]EME87723.1 hypothetical protein MYCFIDRAFT_181037 [Pseudocercospora fijiensis CIRAD86]
MRMKLHRRRKPGQRQNFGQGQQSQLKFCTTQSCSLFEFGLLDSALWMAQIRDSSLRELLRHDGCSTEINLRLEVGLRGLIRY